MGEKGAGVNPKSDESIAPQLSLNVDDSHGMCGARHADLVA
jgi:hypothetical protein